MAYDEALRLMERAKDNPSIAKFGSFHMRVPNRSGKAFKALCESSGQALDLIFAKFSDVARWQDAAGG